MLRGEDMKKPEQNPTFSSQRTEKGAAQQDRNTCTIITATKHLSKQKLHETKLNSYSR